MELSTEGIKLDLSTPRGALSLESRLIGRINAYNVLAAAAAGAALDLPLQAIHRGIAALTQVPGRMQVGFRARRRGDRRRRFRPYE